MTAVAIRKKLVDYMQVPDDRTLKAIYILLEKKIEENHISFRPGRVFATRSFNENETTCETPTQKGATTSIHTVKHFYNFMLWQLS